MCFLEIALTLAYACGIDITSSPPKQHVDGVNIWDTLAGDESEHQRRDLLFWHGSQGFQAIRVDQWKLYPDGKNSQLSPEKEGPALFNLKDDIGERTDVSANYPDKVREMTQLASQRLADIQENNIPLTTIEKETRNAQ